MKPSLFARVWRFCFVATMLGLSVSAKAEDCSVSVSQPVVSFGQSHREEMEPVGDGLLVGSRVITLSISCAENTGMGLSFDGERAGEQGYRFAQHGMFTLKVLHAQVDGRPVRLRERNAPLDSKSLTGLFRPGVTLVPHAQGQVVHGEQLNAQIELTTYVSEEDTRVRTREDWEGRGEFVIENL